MQAAANIAFRKGWPSFPLLWALSSLRTRDLHPLSPTKNFADFKQYQMQSNFKWIYAQKPNLNNTVIFVSL